MNQVKEKKTLFGGKIGLLAWIVVLVLGIFGGNFLVLEYSNWRNARYFKNFDDKEVCSAGIELSYSGIYGYAWNRKARETREALRRGLTISDCLKTLDIEPEISSEKQRKKYFDSDEND